MTRYDCKQCNEFFESEDESELGKLAQNLTLTTGHAEFTVSTTSTARWSVTS